jgi:hypothetical protein
MVATSIARAPTPPLRTRYLGDPATQREVGRVASLWRYTPSSFSCKWSFGCAFPTR